MNEMSPSFIGRKSGAVFVFVQDENYFSPLRAWVLEYLKRNMNVTDFSWHFSSKTISNFIFIILLSI